MEIFKSLYEYRELLKTNIKKEIRGKYKGSFLGVLWSFINPLLQVMVYAIVFPYLMGNVVDNYLIYLIIGIIPWTFFTTVVSQGVATISVNSGIVKKVYFPREILPLSVVISGLINFLISCIIILAFTVFSGIGVSIYLLYLPLIAILQTVFSLGIVFAISAINIYIKDTEYIVQFILNMLFYGTPILYVMTIFPESIRWILYLNPMTLIINSYRDIFLYAQAPNFQMLIILGLVSLIVLLVGYAIFKKLEKGFAEEI